MKKIFIPLFILFFLAGGFFVYKKFFTKKEEIKVLKTAQVIRGKIQDIINATAIVKTQVNAYVKVGARATGTIQEMNVDIGDHVKKGELIAVIDQREILKDIQKAEADYKKSIAKLENIKKVYPVKIKEAKKKLKSAQAAYEYAKWKFEREEKLLKEEFTTKENYEIAKRELEKKKAELEVAKAELERLKKEYKTLLAETKQQVKYAKENLEKQKVRLSYTLIYSPIDGIVSKIAARKGETVVAGLQVANLITILDPTKLEVRIYTDETDIGKVKPGQKVIYFVDAYPDKKFEGVISSIYPEPVVKQNIVYYMSIVKVKPEYTKYLRPEMTVYAKIITGEKDNALLIPNEALKYEKGKQYVYKIVNGKPVKTYIKTGWMDEKYTEVLEGLKEGDIIAVKLILPKRTKELR
ncbi:MAG: efflux RND transporter periplasmic adaptor subunit [Aquificae bacterium]|nr:efflux RND transporter periplasmic adaptor subunit [Aquificota bacterium]